MAITGIFPRTLKSRMTTVVIMLVLAATTIVTTVALLLAERDMKSVIGTQQYAVLSSAAAYVDEQLEAKRALLATLPEAFPRGTIVQPAALQAMLEARPVVRAEFFNIVIFDRQGRQVASQRPGLREASVDASGQPYFDNTVKTGKGLISAPFLSRLSGRPVVLLTQPILDPAGDVAYVITGGIDLQQSDFFGPINALKPGKTGFMFIMTAEGVLIHHPTASRLLQHIHARPGTNVATDMALAGFEGWTVANNKDGNEGIYSYRRLNTTNWIVGARFPTDEAFAPLIELRRQAILAATVFAAIAGLVAWVAIHRLLSPLQGLRASLVQISQGGVGIESLRSGGQDEIGELGESFYRLTAERAAAQARTRESETLVRNILEHAPDAFVSVDAHGNVTEWNVQAEQSFGWTREEAMGRSVAELLVPERARAAYVAGMLAFSRTGGGPLARHRVRVAALCKDGREVPVELSVGALRHGDEYVATAFLHDVSERVAYETKIEASEKRLKLITDNLPALVSYIDRDHMLRFGNATFRQWLGIDPATLGARPLLEVAGEAGYQHCLPHLERAFGNETVCFELRTRLHGDMRTLETTFVPDVRPDGSVAGVYSLTQDLSRIKAVERQLIELARVDSLTGIANRRKFEEALLQAMARSRRSGRPMALAYLDIDNFKSINDTMGHGAGDEVLKEFSRRLAAAVRTVDLVARLAGDEFVIVFENVAQPGEAARLAAKIVATVRAKFSVLGTAMQVSTSIGVALFHGDGESQAGLLSRADRALYQAKRNGRDCFVVDGETA